jgi:uncharacterized protein (DUF362 family)
MRALNRRQFLAVSAGLAASSLPAAAPDKNRIGLVRSTNKSLRRPASVEDPLDYDQVRDMVWQAIEHAGGMANRIQPGSWVVLKPNMVFLRPQEAYRPGDITDLRVVQAVLEYLARNTGAGRITIAEGGSYRGMRDAASDNVVSQNGTRVDARTFRWPAEEFRGTGGSLGEMLARAEGFAAGKRLDYVDLCYDGVRDKQGKLIRVPVPKAANGTAGFGARQDYFVTRTITGCDYLVSVPVMKVHMQCGITASLKNYVGTAPREAYAEPGKFWNIRLHAEHSVEDRIDPFIADLSSFHPPDFVIADGIRGLQYQEHNMGAPDQTVRSNLVLASRDPVAADAMAAYLLGFNPLDIEYLHMAQARGTGCPDLAASDVRGDDPGVLRASWIKPGDWHGRGNREWKVTGRPDTPVETWTRYTSPTDSLQFAAAAGEAPSYAASVRVTAAGHRKAFLWIGLAGRMTASLNGEQIMQAEGLTRYRVGQFRKAVELRPGENRLEFRVQPAAAAPRLSVLLVGPRNDGDTLDEIRWAA